MFFNDRSIKWLEVPIQKFNTTVPHFVSLLKSHNTNILKLRKLEQWDEMEKELNTASRTANQLQSLVSEIESLRDQVIESDLNKFDKRIKDTKQTVLSTIERYESIKAQVCQTSAIEDNHTPIIPSNFNQVSEKLQVVADLCETIKHEEGIAASLEEVQGVAKEISDLFQELSAIVQEEGETVKHIEVHVERTAENVVEGERMLSQAARYKAGVYPLVGALIGSVMGGPVGLLAGFKFGSITAVGCGVLGFTGGKFLKNRNAVMIEEAEHNREHVLSAK